MNRMMQRILNSKHRFWLMLGIVICLFSTGLACIHFFKKAPHSEPALLRVTVIEPVIKTVDAQVHLSGLTVPREEIVVMSELSGLHVQAVFAQVGNVVKKGQLLARLNKEGLAHQVAQLSYEYGRVLDEYQRMNKLKDTGAFSKQTLIQKQAESNLAKDRLEDAKLNVSKTEVLAPQDGLIFERKAVIGEVVHAHDPLYRIAHGGIEFQADVPEAALANIQIGQKVTITFSGHNTPIDGNVRLIEPNIDYASRTARIRIQLDNKKEPLPIGLFGQAQIITQALTGAVVPQSAVHQDSHGFYVWVIDAHSKAHRMAVHIKLRNQGSIIIEPLVPFKAHTHIVAKAGAFVSEGEKLDIVKSTGDK